MNSHSTNERDRSSDQGAQSIRAAVMRVRARPLEFEELTLEAPRPDEVMVRMVATGLCHTDIAMRDTRDDLPIPTILGHEGAGVITAVGANVRKVAIGDHVVLSFMSCGRCCFCVRGEPAYCENWLALNFSCARGDGTVSTNCEGQLVHNHFFGQSSFATYALANERNVVKVPKTAPLELLGPLGCGLQTGAGAVMNALKISAGESFVCFGTGSVGLAAIMAARIVGAGIIIAVDVNDQRLEKAIELGATHSINSKTSDAVAKVKQICDGRGVDYSLDTTGIPAVLDQALDVLDRRGTCGIVSSGQESRRTFDARRLMAQGQRIIGIIEGDAIPELFILDLLKLHEQGRFPFEKMVTFYDFNQINQAFEDSHHGLAIKPIIRFPGAQS